MACVHGCLPHSGSEFYTDVAEFLLTHEQQLQDISPWKLGRETNEQQMA